jgi:hypothetical protein
VCEVATPAGLSSIAASERGLAFAVQPAEGSELIVQRSHGAGCDLSTEGESKFAAGGLLDTDDLGNLYIWPAKSTHTGVRSTMLRDTFESLGSTLMKVDLSGHVSELVYAGRGIWDFGVSPGGDAIWVTACGPTGIFSVAPSGLTLSLPPPDSLWQQMPSVLTSASTFWSVGVRTCFPPADVTPSCGFALVRTTPDGSENVGTTLIDFGAGFEQATLVRCGSRVCGVFTSAVVIWDAEGRVVRTITSDDVSALDSEHIAQVTGNDRGVYLLLRSDTGSRVVFVASGKSD